MPKTKTTLEVAEAYLENAERDVEALEMQIDELDRVLCLIGEHWAEKGGDIARVALEARLTVKAVVARVDARQAALRVPLTAEELEIPF